MALEYYLKRAGQEAGPFRFRDLIALARDGNLTDSDLVRYSWTNEWKRADSLVGLFYMARRTPEAVAQPEISTAISAASEPVIQVHANEELPVADVNDRPGWMKRLLFVGSREKKRGVVPILGPPAPELPPAVVLCDPSADAVPVFQPALVEILDHGPASGQAHDAASEMADPGPPDAEKFRSHWASTVDKALASVTARQSGDRLNLHTGRGRKLFHRLLKFVPGNWQGDGWLRVGYRVVSTLVVAAIVAVSAANWSEEEGHRYLRGASQKATMRMFPVVGKCSTGTYWFLIADLVLATGAVTWFGAGWLESHAE